MEVHRGALSKKRTSFRGGGRFAAEALGMCAVMCIGGQLLSRAFFSGAAAFGSANLAQQAPELSTAVVATCIAVPMAIYMAIRRHGRRHNLEMAAGTLAVAGLLVIAFRLALIPSSSITSWDVIFGMVCGPACAVMFVMMVFAYKMYSGAAAHGHQAGS